MAHQEMKDHRQTGGVQGRSLFFFLFLFGSVSTALATDKQYCVNVNYSAVPSLVNNKKITLMVNVGTCASVAVTADGASVPATYISSSGTALFTTTGSNITVTAVNWTTGGTGAATKATLFNNYHWAYSLTFDDNRQSQYTNGKPVLDSHLDANGNKWRAASAVVGSWANQATAGNTYWMSWATLQTLRAAGWDILNHSMDHPNPMTCNGSGTDIGTEVSQDQTLFQTRITGYNVTHLVFPYENSSANTCAGFPPVFLLSSECGGGSYNTIDASQGTAYHQYQRGGLFGTDDTAWKTLADQAAASANHTWLIEYTHGVAAGSGAPEDAYSTNVATLTDLLNHLDTTYGTAGNKSLWFAPASEVRDYLFTRDNAVVTTCTVVTSTSTPTSAATNTPTATPSFTKTSTPTSTNTFTSTNTSTFTSTSTRTFTSTNTRTVTPTNTATATMTVTSTATFTPTKTSTPSFTSTSTNSFTSTSTSTGTPSFTPTSTASFTRTNTNSFTPTSTFTSTATSTFTNSSTSTYSFTNSPTQTLTSTKTSTNTATATATSTATSTNSNTSTPSRTHTPTLTSTSTATPTNTGTSTNTSTGTASPTAASTATGTFTFTVTNTLSPTASATSSPTATRTFTLTSTNSFTSTSTRTFTSTNTSTVTPTNSVTTTSTATPTSTDSFTSTSTPTDSNTPTMTFTGTLSPTPTFTHTSTSTATSTPTLTPTNTDTSTATATSTSTKTSTPTKSSTPTATPSFTSTSTNSPTFTPTFTKSFTPTATLTSSFTSTSTTTPTFTGTSSFTSTATATSSFTSTSTSSSTPTFTATRTSTPTNTPVGNPTPVLFPNPVTTGDTVNLLPSVHSGNQTVVIGIFTTRFRKVSTQTFADVMPGQPVKVVLNDQWGKPLANGLYYVVVIVDGHRSIVKLLIVR